MNTGYAVGERGCIIKTTDGGSHLTLVNSGIYCRIWNIQFPTALIGYAICDSGYVYKTTDAGLNWTKMAAAAPPIISLFGISFPTADTGYVCGAQGWLAKTTDGGLSWAVLPGISGTLINDMKWTSLHSGYLVGSRGTIIKASDTAAFVPFITADVGMLVISPNPASRMAKITYVLNGRSDVSISLSDLTGKKLQDAGCGMQDSGVHEFLMKLEGLMPGVYFVRVDAGKRRLAGKLVVK
ncbi:MAG: T9SS type A sorting domain-containing protein [Bacteroidales bacterium]